MKCDLEEFKNDLAMNKCPFCKGDLEWYDGVLGYEAHKCKKCEITIDHNGLHWED